MVGDFTEIQLKILFLLGLIVQHTHNITRHTKNNEEFSSRFFWRPQHNDFLVRWYVGTKASMNLVHIAESVELWEAKNQEGQSQRGAPRSLAALGEVNNQGLLLIHKNLDLTLIVDQYNLF